MATFSPIITTSSPVTVVSGVPTISYQEILESIRGGGYQNKVNGVYIYASSFNQLTSTWTLTKPTQSGTLSVTPTVFLIDPAQKQPTAFLDLKQYDFVLDTLTTLFMQMQPFSSASLVLFSDAQQYYQAFSRESPIENKKEDSIVLENKDISVTQTGNKNNTIAKKALMVTAGVGIVYLIVTKL